MSVLKIKNKKTGEWETIASLKGDAGKDGINGKDGKDYILTEEDKAEIAQLALAAMPAAEDGEF
jgi:hypothetical protein